MSRKLIYMMIIIISLASVLAIRPALAQPPWPGPGQSEMGGPGGHARNLESLRLLKLLEALDLTEEQSDRFIVAFSEFRKAWREVNEQIQMEVLVLSELMEQEKPDVEKVQKKVVDIELLRNKREATRNNFYEKAKGILTPLQIGKMVVFEESFEKKLLESVRGFRKHHAPFPDSADEL